MTISNPIPARLAALKTMSGAELKKQWRPLSDTEPHQFNRRYTETRLGYRIHELNYGGLKLETGLTYPSYAVVELQCVDLSIHSLPHKKTCTSSICSYLMID